MVQVKIRIGVRRIDGASHGWQRKSEAAITQKH